MFSSKQKPPHHHNSFMALFRGHPGEPVPEESYFWTSWCQQEADTLTICIGTTPSGPISNPPPSIPHFYAGCPSCRNPPNLSWHGTGTGMCWIAYPHSLFKEAKSNRHLFSIVKLVYVIDGDRQRHLLTLRRLTVAMTKLMKMMMTATVMPPTRATCVTSRCRRPPTVCSVLRGAVRHFIAPA